jgi:hypothetical protein
MALACADYFFQVHVGLVAARLVEQLQVQPNEEPIVIGEIWHGSYRQLQETTAIYEKMLEDHAQTLRPQQKIRVIRVCKALDPRCSEKRRMRRRVTGYENGSSRAKFLTSTQGCLAKTVSGLMGVDPSRMRLWSPAMRHTSAGRRKRSWAARCRSLAPRAPASP